jgi:hypothetical protein
MKILLYDNLWQSDKTELPVYHWSPHFYIPYFLTHNSHFLFPQKYPQKSPCILTLDDEFLHMWATKSTKYLTNCTVHLMKHTRQDIQFCWWSTNHKLLFVLLTHTFHTGTCNLYGTEFHNPSCVLYDTVLQMDRLRHCLWSSCHRQHGNL